MNTPIKTPKKLIEVAIPLDAINVAAAKEKTIRHGHPSNLHRWWARRPQVAARAVIFAQMVNDPGFQQGGGFRYGVNKEKAAIERERLFKIIEDLVLWENTNNEEVLERARVEIRRSWRETCELNKAHPQAAELFNPDKLPAFHDPFAGGGALPLEAQRLGLESFASDLNPVAVTINKAMIEIPPKFAGRAPVGPAPELKGKASQEMFNKQWQGAQGLAEDVRRYGAWMRNEAQKRIGHLYPQIEVTPELIAANARSACTSGLNDPKNLHNTGLAGLQAGQKLTVIAWLWARTVKSPNPAFSHVDVPLVSSFILSSKMGKEAYVLPVMDSDRYRFEVRFGTPPESVKNGTKLTRGANFRCLMSDAPIEPKHIYAEANAGRMGAKLMAIVAEGARGRVYLTPTAEHEAIAQQAQPDWRPDVAMPENPRWFSPPLYGLKTYGDIFTPRQLVALTTFSDLMPEAIARVRADALAAGMANDGLRLDAGGNGATAYAEAIGVYLAMIVSKTTDSNSSLCPWEPVAQCTRQVFGRQAIPMLWDFGEANPLHDSSGGFLTNIAGSVRAFDTFASGTTSGVVDQADASTQTISRNKVVSTDPPYYDNIGYADLSDFFYVWLRKSLRPIFPSLYATLAVPKAEELVATPYRHGGKVEAEAFFLDGMTRAVHNLAEHAHPAFPVTIYYAFKQTDTKGEAGTSSTGWETFLDAVIRAGFCITGTWPIRSEMTAALKALTNSLASSIVLVCRKRLADAITISRRDFIRELNAVLPEALNEMTQGGINSSVAPVDLSQAIIGPGMAIFSQYAAVLEADGTPMSVRTALQLINRFFAEDDFDHDTQFCLAWFNQQGWATAKFGDADVLARAKGTSVGGLVESGVVASSAGNLRLTRWAELAKDWSPEKDNHTPVWESLHQLVRALNQDGESAAGALLARMPARAEPIRALAYRLYTLCERKGWAEDARAYNELVTAWQSIEQASADAGILGSQATLDM
jgi:putative DNA methylase